MSVPAAYLGIILIWSTTPLAIQWSSEGAGFLFGVTARMGLGAALCLLLLLALRVPLPWHREARRAYAAASLGVYGAMMLTYWGAQFIPSGLISVLYGLSPLLTGWLAARWLGEYSLSPAKMAGLLLGLAGLMFIFAAGQALAPIAWQGIAAVLGAVLLHSISLVLVKRTGGELHPVAMNSGALLLSSALYLLTWGVFGAGWPVQVPQRAWWAIGYLGLFGTVLGFVLYFYVLKRLPAGVIALITLVTPVLALLIGRGLNGETVDLRVWLGTGCILAGLVLYQWGSAVVRWLRRRLSGGRTVRTG